MPNLGKYADTVISAYIISIVLILALIIVSLIKAKRSKTKLEDLEGNKTDLN